MDRHQQFMLNALWAVVGVILMVDVFQNCWLGVDCIHANDGVITAWLTALVNWLLLSAPAFLLSIWLITTTLIVVRLFRNDA